MRIGIVTLGCDKNTVDNEHLAGLLAARGHQVVKACPGGRGFDAIVITTCGFIEAARGQSIQEIARWAKAKGRRGGPARLIVAGCLSQRFTENLLAAYPQIDGLAGVGNLESLADMVEQADAKSEEVCLAVARKPSMKFRRAAPRMRLDSAPYAYLKTGDGCGHHCSFCSIPLMKGPNRSVPPGVLEREARALIRSGVRELILIGQDLSQYGRDLGQGAPDLADLLARLAVIEGDFQIRLLYLYPAGVTDKLLRVMAREPKICRYLDIPLQHLDPGVLKAMKRPGGRIRGEALFARIRRALPGVALRTTLVVGFPGETDKAFAALLEGAKRMRIDRLGAFVFSPETGTPAAELPNQVAPHAAARRLDRLMRAQARIALALNKKRVGRREIVLYDRYDAERRAAVARSQYEAPEVDGVIYVEGAGPACVGQFGEVLILRADGYDLWARVAPEASIGSC